jgi:hypothetical protein
MNPEASGRAGSFGDSSMGEHIRGHERLPLGYGHLAVGGRACGWLKKTLPLLVGVCLAAPAWAREVTITCEGPPDDCTPLADAVRLRLGERGTDLTAHVHVESARATLEVLLDTTLLDDREVDLPDNAGARQRALAQAVVEAVTSAADRAASLPPTVGGKRQPLIVPGPAEEAPPLLHDPTLSLGLGGGVLGKIDTRELAGGLGLSATAGSVGRVGAALALSPGPSLKKPFGGVTLRRAQLHVWAGAGGKLDFVLLEGGIELGLAGIAAAGKAFGATLATKTTWSPIVGARVFGAVPLGEKLALGLQLDGAAYLRRARFRLGREIAYTTPSSDTHAALVLRITL